MVRMQNGIEARLLRKTFVEKISLKLKIAVCNLYETVKLYIFQSCITNDAIELKLQMFVCGRTFEINQIIHFCIVRLYILHNSYWDVCIYFFLGGWDSQKKLLGMNLFDSNYIDHDLPKTLKMSSPRSNNGFTGYSATCDCDLS